MFERMRYQQGCLTQEARRIGPNVWVFRWREACYDGRRRSRKAIVGTAEPFPTKSLAKNTVEGLRLDINKEVLGGMRGPVTFGQLIAHYQEKELLTDMSLVKVQKAYSTTMTYRRYLRKWIKPRWDSCLLRNIQPIAVEDWLHGLAAANGTKAKIRNIMSALFRNAVRYGFCRDTKTRIRSNTFGRAQRAMSFLSSLRRTRFGK